jgi:hypothetical protein
MVEISFFPQYGNIGGIFPKKKEPKPLHRVKKKQWPYYWWW